MIQGRPVLIYFSPDPIADELKSAKQINSFGKYTYIYRTCRMDHKK